MDNNAQHQSQASLAVYSRKLSAEELKQLVPFPPDESVIKGTPRVKLAPSNVHPHNAMIYKSRLERSQSLNAHLGDLLTRLYPAKDAIRDFARHARSEGFQSPTGLPFAPVILRLYMHVRNPDQPIGFDISNDQLKAICDLGAVLTVEVESYDECHVHGTRYEQHVR